MDSDDSLRCTSSNSSPLLPPNIKESKGGIGAVVVITPAIGEMITEAVGFYAAPTSTKTNIDGIAYHVTHV